MQIFFADDPSQYSHLMLMSFFSIIVPKKGRKKALTLGQVGIGCTHCRYSEKKLKGCTYFPSSISGIYNATMIIQQRHFPVCPSVSKEIHSEYNKLKVLTARSASTKEYWIFAAKKLVSVHSGALSFHITMSTFLTSKSFTSLRY
jgi:hypothetical protein